MPLSNTAGAVLDPIVSLRRHVRLEPGKLTHIACATAVAASREAVLGLADKYHDSAMFERTATLAWTHAHIQQHHLGMLPSEAHLFQDLAIRILYSNADLRPPREILERSTRGAPGFPRDEGRTGRAGRRGEITSASALSQRTPRAGGGCGDRAD